MSWDSSRRQVLGGAAATCSLLVRDVPMLQPAAAVTMASNSRARAPVKAETRKFLTPREFDGMP